MQKKPEQSKSDLPPATDRVSNPSTDEGVREEKRQEADLEDKQPAGDGGPEDEEENSKVKIQNSKNDQVNY